MFAIEFKTQIKVGVVHIPEQYKELYQSEAKIVVLVETESKIAPTNLMHQNTFFRTLRNRHIHIEKNINIDNLMQGSNMATWMMV